MAPSKSSKSSTIRFPPYKCDHCVKKFDDMGVWKRHQRTHTGEKPFECEHCDKKFREKGHLKIHMRIHTGEKPFKCIECGKNFIDRSSLMKHMVTHKVGSSVKTLKCGHCDKDFKSKGGLQKHVCTFALRTFERDQAKYITIQGDQTPLDIETEDDNSTIDEEPIPMPMYNNVHNHSTIDEELIPMFEEPILMFEEPIPEEPIPMYINIEDDDVTIHEVPLPMYNKTKDNNITINDKPVPFYFKTKGGAITIKEETIPMDMKTEAEAIYIKEEPIPMYIKTEAENIKEENPFVEDIKAVEKDVLVDNDTIAILPNDLRSADSLMVKEFGMILTFPSRPLTKGDILSRFCALKNNGNHRGHYTSKDINPILNKDITETAIVAILRSEIMELYEKFGIKTISSSCVREKIKKISKEYHDSTKNVQARKKFSKDMIVSFKAETQPREILQEHIDWYDIKLKELSSADNLDTEDTADISVVDSDPSCDVLENENAEETIQEEIPELIQSPQVNCSKEDWSELAKTAIRFRVSSEAVQEILTEYTRTIGIPLSHIPSDTTINRYMKAATENMRNRNLETENEKSGPRVPQKSGPLVLQKSGPRVLQKNVPHVFKKRCPHVFEKSGPHVLQIDLDTNEATMASDDSAKPMPPEILETQGTSTSRSLGQRLASWYKLYGT